MQFRHLFRVAAGAAAAVAVAVPALSAPADQSFELDVPDVALVQQHLVTAVDDSVADARRDVDLVAANATQVDLVDSYVAETREALRRSEMDDVWNALADCESGDWMNGQPLPDTRRWDYGLTFSHGDIFEGGVNFHPQTWDSYKEPGMPGHAGHATREQQIAVAEDVLRDQGWKAWPVCSRKLGLR